MFQWCGTKTVWIKIPIFSIEGSISQLKSTLSWYEFNNNVFLLYNDWNFKRLPRKSGDITWGNFKRNISHFSNGNQHNYTSIESIRKGYWASLRLSHTAIGNVVCIVRGEKRRISLCFEVCVAGCYRNMLLHASFSSWNSRNSSDNEPWNRVNTVLWRKPEKWRP